MKDLKDLLQKFKSVGLKEHTIKDNLIEILKEEINIELSRKHIDIKDNRLRLLISGPPKTSVLLKKSYILEKLNSQIEDLEIKILDIN